MSKENDVKISKEELDRLLERDKTLKKKEDKQRDSWRRRNAKLMLMYQKGVDKGLKVSEVEIDEYLKTSLRRK